MGLARGIGETSRDETRASHHFLFYFFLFVVILIFFDRPDCSRAGREEEARIQ